MVKELKNKYHVFFKVPLTFQETFDKFLELIEKDEDIKADNYLISTWKGSIVPIAMRNLISKYVAKNQDKL